MQCAGLVTLHIFLSNFEGRVRAIHRQAHSHCQTASDSSFCKMVQVLKWPLLRRRSSCRQHRSRPKAIGRGCCEHRILQNLLIERDSPMQQCSLTCCSFPSVCMHAPNQPQSFRMPRKPKSGPRHKPLVALPHEFYSDSKCINKIVPIKVLRDKESVPLWSAQSEIATVRENVLQHLAICCSDAPIAARTRPFSERHLLFLDDRCSSKDPWLHSEA